jgi:hypothetical protein
MTIRWAFFLLMALAFALPARGAVKEIASKPSPRLARATAKIAPVALSTGPHSATVLSAEKLAISDKVYLGKIQCELASHVTIKLDPNSLGRFVLETGQHRFLMEPVVTSTGAVRLEDSAGGAVWLQLANKSMLMNQKLGKRMADECMHPEQLLVAQALARSPEPGLLDAPREALVPVGPGNQVQEMVPNATK